MMATLAELWRERALVLSKKYIVGFVYITQGPQGSLGLWHIFLQAARSVDWCVRLAAKHDAVIPMPPCFLLK